MARRSRRLLRWLMPILMLIVVATGYAAPRRVSGKGLRYALELALPGESEPMHLSIEPGPDAWLAPAWGERERATVRTGRGFKWWFVPDSRKVGALADLYLEVEPLGPNTFETAADLYASHLGDTWDYADYDLKRTLSRKPTRPRKLCGQRVSGIRLQQEVLKRRTGQTFTATLVLLPLHGHLVVLTGVGGKDVLTDALRGLEAADERWGEQEHTYHCLDILEGPTWTYLVLTTPKGYAPLPGTPDIAQPDFVNRWERRASEGSTETLTYLRMGSATVFTPERALSNWRRMREGTGMVAESPGPVDVDGQEAYQLSYVSADGRGMLVAWQSGDHIYALHSHTTATDEASAGAQRGDFTSILGRMRTWRGQ